jgi:hypothetical protein
MSESKSKDDMTLEERRRDALEHGYTLDDSLDEDPIVPDEKESAESAKSVDEKNDGDGKSDR